MKLWSRHKAAIPAPAPEPKPEPKPEPTYNIADLASRWGIDSLEAVKRVTESEGFPTEYGECYEAIYPSLGANSFGHKKFTLNGMGYFYSWHGPDGQWLQADIIVWEQSFAIADHKKKEAAIIHREIISRSKKEKA